jgi:5'-nucleotidase
MYNIFPFDNSITKMNLSGTEIQDLFDFAARRSAGRGCVSQVQIAGARIVMDCKKQDPDYDAPGVATNIYIGVTQPKRSCTSDADCGAGQTGSCDPNTSLCWQKLDREANYELATSNYLAAGGSGFRVLQRNTTQFDTGVQQRDALIDYIRAGHPCGSDSDGKLKSCSHDGDCASVGEGFVCACPEASEEVDGVCQTNSKVSCGGKGQCVLAKCRDDVAAFQRTTCEAAIDPGVKQQCEQALDPCTVGGEQCKYLACVDRRLGNFSDDRLKMVGQ